MNFYDFLTDYRRTIFDFSDIAEIDETGFDDVISNSASSVAAINNIRVFKPTREDKDYNKFCEYIRELEEFLATVKDNDHSVKYLKQAVKDFNSSQEETVSAPPLPSPVMPAPALPSAVYLPPILTASLPSPSTFKKSPTTAENLAKVGIMAKTIADSQDGAISLSVYKSHLDSSESHGLESQSLEYAGHSGIVTRDTNILRIAKFSSEIWGISNINTPDGTPVGTEEDGLPLFAASSPEPS